MNCSPPDIVGHVGEGLEVLRELEEDVDVVVGPVGRVLLQALPDGVPHDQGRLLKLVSLLLKYSVDMLHLRQLWYLGGDWMLT